MPAQFTSRLLDPAVLTEISRLDLIAKTVVEGFVVGLHRSPDFGFSQEFAEYRAYTPGDDLRHVDWNVFARTERMYLKRYRGETNTQLTVLLDTSASMGYGSGVVKKIQFAKFLAASLIYLAHLQRDSAGLITFDDHVEQFVRPSGRQGQLMRLLHAIDQAQLGKRTNFAQPFIELQQFLKRRGITIVVSDFFEDPNTIIRVMEPLRFRGNELVLFHVLDPMEIEPRLDGPVLLLDMETDEPLETTPEYARTGYREKISAHMDEFRTKSQAAGIDYFFVRTDCPLDVALREYFTIRKRRA
jgi:uncharacterized protein (DUF58 family)